MHPQTEEFLNFLFWSAERLLCPVYRRIDSSSYESWAYKKGLPRQMKVLQDAKLIEADERAGGDRMYRLTNAGRLHALGGRDPIAHWGRAWDGRWRLVIFDVPTARNTERARLRRYLREHGFGCLQRSVWVTPDALNEEKTILRGGDINVQTLVLLEAHAFAGESDEQIVAGSWDFSEISNRYQKYLNSLGERPTGALRTLQAAKALQLWAAMERQTWLHAVSLDPL